MIELHITAVVDQVGPTAEPGDTLTYARATIEHWDVVVDAGVNTMARAIEANAEDCLHTLEELVPDLDRRRVRWSCGVPLIETVLNEVYR